MEYSFSYHTMTDLQPVPEQQSWNTKLTNFWKFCKTLKKTRTPRKVQTPGQDKIWTSGKQKEPIASSPQPTPITNWVWCLWYGIFHWPDRLCVQLWSLPAPACLLVSWIRETGKSPDFIATTEDRSLISTLQVLNLKHSSYWEEN